MTKCTFSHGGKSYDEKYPEGIPTSISITLKGGKKYESGFVMFPSGHSRNTSANLKDILTFKNNLLGRLALSESELTQKLSLLINIETASNQDLQNLYDCKINVRKYSVDEEKFTEWSRIRLSIVLGLDIINNHRFSVPIHFLPP